MNDFAIRLQGDCEISWKIFRLWSRLEANDLVIRMWFAVVRMIDDVMVWEDIEWKHTPEAPKSLKSKPGHV